jgi:hypothetical protein
MFDLTTLLVGMIMLAGVVGVGAGLQSNQLQLDINVPSKVAEQGFTEQIAEVEFLSECAAMQRLTGLVQPLPIHVALQRTIASAVSELLHLGHFTRAIQEYVGGRMAVSGTLMLYVTLPVGVTMIQGGWRPVQADTRGRERSALRFLSRPRNHRELPTVVADRIPHDRRGTPTDRGRVGQDRRGPKVRSPIHDMDIALRCRILGVRRG